MNTILFLAANPLGTEPLRLDEEVNAIDGALRTTEFRDQFNLQSHWALRVNELQELFLRHKPDIVHFSGHGSDASEIVLQNDKGEPFMVPAHALRDLFQIFRNQIRCVILNACFSAEQAVGISDNIDTVIGMSNAITDRAAIQFSTAFYRGIGYGKDVLTAYNLGRNQIDLSNISEADTPQLLSKTDPATIRFSIETVSQEDVEMNQPIPDDQPWWSQLSKSSLADDLNEKSGDTIIVDIGPGAKNIAAGKNIYQVVNELLGEPQVGDKAVIQSQFAQLRSSLDGLEDKIEPMTKQIVDFQLQLLEGELTKIEESEVPSASTITQVGDWLLKNIPDLAEALTSLFATPAIGKVVGKAGEAAVTWIRDHFS